jgi:hypothetical protein
MMDLFAGICQRINDPNAKFPITPELLCAIGTVESNLDGWKVRFEPSWSYYYEVAHFAKVVDISVATEKVCQAMSWGVIQIMGSCARQRGFDGDLTQLCQPELGVYYGALHLKGFMIRYSGNLQDAIAAYNAGSARRQIVGQTTGPYVNQTYVDKVIKVFEQLKKEKTNG